MRDAGQLVPSRRTAPRYRLVNADPPQPALCRSLFREVGRDYRWYSRLPWSEARWLEHLSRPQVETWLCDVGGTTAGYFELEGEPGGDQEIAFFGLRPAFVGRGLGGHLLTDSIRRGFERGAPRVWVHTCDLDHPSALANYQARGLRIYDTRVADEVIPELEAWEHDGR